MIAIFVVGGAAALVALHAAEQAAARKIAAAHGCGIEDAVAIMEHGARAMQRGADPASVTAVGARVASARNRQVTRDITAGRLSEELSAMFGADAVPIEDRVTMRIAEAAGVDLAPEAAEEARRRSPRLRAMTNRAAKIARAALGVNRRQKRRKARRARRAERRGVDQMLVHRVAARLAGQMNIPITVGDDVGAVLQRHPELAVATKATLRRIREQGADISVPRAKRKQVRRMARRAGRRL
jgi:hypothetical protein